MVNQLLLPEWRCHWNMRPVYQLEPYWIWRSIWYGLDVTPQLSDATRQVAVRNSDKDPWLWTHSRMGECIGARHHIVPRESLRWGKGADPGHDYVIPADGGKPDLKTTDHWKRLLIFSHKKVDRERQNWNQMDFDRLILIKSFVMERPPQFTFMIWGHISKARFFRECRWADGRWPKLDPGTPYLDQNELDLIDEPLTP